MNSKLLWKPVLVGAIVFGGLACLIIVWFAVALDGSASDLVGLGLRLLPIGGLIGAALGALFAVIRKRFRGKGEKASQSE
jgi:hypothetical protein